MKKLAMTFTTAAFLLGTMAMTANAQTQSLGVASTRAQIHNATPIVKQAACRGFGAHCPPGFIWRCGPYGCSCVPCF